MRCDFYFFTFDHFQAIYEIELNSHRKSYKSLPTLGLPVIKETHASQPPHIPQVNY